MTSALGHHIQNGASRSTCSLGDSKPRACLELIQHPPGVHHHDQGICGPQLWPHHILCDVLQEASICWPSPCRQRRRLSIQSAPCPFHFYLPVTSHTEVPCFSIGAAHMFSSRRQFRLSMFSTGGPQYHSDTSLWALHGNMGWIALLARAPAVRAADSNAHLREGDNRETSSFRSVPTAELHPAWTTHKLAHGNEIAA